MSVTLTTRLALADEELNYGDVYYTVFPIPARALTAILGRATNANRILLSINGKGELSVGLMPDGKGDYFITVSRAVRDRFAISEGEEVTLTLQPDDSAYGMPLPEEFAELWALDEAARQTFHRLTPGKQRALIYQVGKLKRPESRAKKAVQISEYLKETDGVVDFKELNAYIKRWNAE